VVSNVEDGSEHVNVEAVHLDIKPGHQGALRWIESASIAVASELFVVHGHLDKEDGTLVAEDRDGVTHATEELPNAVSVANTH